MDNIITISNIQDFKWQIVENDLILTRINPSIDETTLFQKNLRSSSILECKINNIITDINKYKRLLIYLYSDMNINTIIEKTTLNISQQKIYDRGYEFYDKLGLSIQSAEARKTLREIINIIKILNYNIKLKIKLKDDEIIFFSI